VARELRGFMERGAERTSLGSVGLVGGTPPTAPQGNPKPNNALQLTAYSVRSAPAFGSS